MAPAPSHPSDSEINPDAEAQGAGMRMMEPMVEEEQRLRPAEQQLDTVKWSVSGVTRRGALG